jgi:predicted AAA+ superfamily ATPase
MIQRHLSAKLKALAAQFPVILLTGPRQAGKTTLAKYIFPHHDYVSLEDPDNREAALADPRSFLGRFKGGAVFDEIQRVPSIFSYLQTEVDRDATAGRFILTGSHHLNLMDNISQTLAGRVAITHLFPLSLSELYGYQAPDPFDIRSPHEVPAPAVNLDQALFAGGYPRIHDKGLEPRDWLASYYQTYVERDVRSIMNIGDLGAFQRFVRLCAGRSGQLLNLSSLGVDASMTHPTVRKWLSVLQAGFIINLLQPHHSNFSKRLVKTSKLFFMDTGLLCYLLGIRSAGMIATHPLRGALFETLVVSEIVKTFANMGEVPPIYFWRDRTGHEVDVIIDSGNELMPVEIKSGATINSSFFDGLRFFGKLGAPAAAHGVLVHGGRTGVHMREGHCVRPWFSPV